MTTISAVINARTQSSRLPEKMLRPFGDTTLFDNALKLLDSIDFVNDKLCAVAEVPLMEKIKKYPTVKLLKRDPASVCKGHMSMEIRFAYLYEIKTDYVLLINSCHPFIQKETLRIAVQKVKETKFNSYTSVISSPDWILDSQGQWLTNRNPKMVSTNQDLTRYKAAHAFHFIRPQFFKETGLLWTYEKNDPHGIVVSEEDALDIDNPLDFEICELLYKKKNGLLI